MGEFFGSIYCLFEDLFGLDLANYLWGQTSPLSQNNQYVSFGIWMLGISAFVVLLYYKILDLPKLNRWWCWLIALGVGAAVCFIYAWQSVKDQYLDGLMVTTDPTTGDSVPIAGIGEGQMLGFGLANAILASVAFFIFSFCVKWWSINCRNQPFRLWRL